MREINFLSSQSLVEFINNHKIILESIIIGVGINNRIVWKLSYVDDKEINVDLYDCYDTSNDHIDWLCKERFKYPMESNMYKEYTHMIIRLNMLK